MTQPRVLPCLLLQGGGLVKTVRFRAPSYLGDPRNAVRIFNEREVDELILLDINATKENRPPRYGLIHEIVSEAFMPVSYGGGIRTLDDARKVFAIGVEKVVVSSYAVENPGFISHAAEMFGSQSIVVCIDVKKDFWGKYVVYTCGGMKKSSYSPIALAREMERCGAGELMINSIDRDGTMQGFDLVLIRSVAQAVGIPVIACGGAGEIDDLRDAVVRGGASAVAAGSLFVFQGRHRAVLISYPKPDVLRRIFQ